MHTRRTNKLPPTRPHVPHKQLLTLVVIVARAPLSTSVRRKSLAAPPAPEQRDIRLIQTARLFSLCLLSIDVDNHPLSGLSQEVSFFLPFPGNLSREAAAHEHVFMSVEEVF